MTVGRPVTYQIAGALLIALTLMVEPAGAQEQHRHFTLRGNVELGGSLSFLASQPVVNDQNKKTIYTVSVIPFVGYFVIDGLELGLNPAALTVNTNGDLTTTQLRVLFAPSYNFRTPSVATPFVEGLAGITLVNINASEASSTLKGFTWGGRAGIKVALVERGLLNIGVQYLRVTTNPEGATTRSGANEFAVNVGWTVWL